MDTSRTPLTRVAPCNIGPVRRDGEFVLYWMIAARRPRWNFALDRAVELAEELRRPLLVFEALRVGYRWASDRLHRFILDGMADNRRALADSPALYYPYVEPAAGAGSGLLEALGRRACVVVTDEFPCFFLPRMVAAAAAKLDVRLEQVDSNGLLPLRAADAAFPTAYAFRRFLQRTLPEHLAVGPRERPFAGARIPRLDALPRDIASRWPAAGDGQLGADACLADLPIDHGAGAAPIRGGALAGGDALARFLKDGLARYAGERNAPEDDATSGLSPYLHFGHVSAHEAFARIAAAEQWTPDKLATKATGQRAGWWGMSEPAQAYLDQLVTWRELGYNMSHRRPGDYDQYDSLPAWARQTLAKHRRDPRPHAYSLAELDAAETHDPLWNAAQRQLVREGRMHNYLRMLWGKKILEWSPAPEQALDAMIELNNRYALDGRNPNSYSGIFWCLGRYDRAWGPERPIFGTVRYMSSDNTARKYRVTKYLERYAP